MLLSEHNVTVGDIAEGCTQLGRFKKSFESMVKRVSAKRQSASVSSSSASAPASNDIDNHINSICEECGIADKPPKRQRMRIKEEQEW